MKGPEDAISVSVVHWRMPGHGWAFEDGPGVAPDATPGARYLHEVHTAADRSHTGRVTVPVLRDKVRGLIVSNEPSEPIRMLNSALDGVGARSDAGEGPDVAPPRADPLTAEPLGRRVATVALQLARGRAASAPAALAAE